MKVYLAAAYAARDVIREGLLQLLEDVAQVDVTSSWLMGSRPITPGTVGTSPDTSDEDVLKHVKDDLADIEEADILVILTHTAVIHLDPELASAPGNTGGRHFECGYAHSLNKPIIVVGKAENVFQRALGIQVLSWSHLLRVLAEMAPKYDNPTKET